METNPVFPPPITALPRADIPIDGLTAHRSQSPGHQLLFMRFERDCVLPEHSHAVQWGIVPEGRIEMAVAGVSGTYRRGDRYHIPQGVAHFGRVWAEYCDITFFDQPDRYAARLGKAPNPRETREK